jgi:hypothetical protein
VQTVTKSSSRYIQGCAARHTTSAFAVYVFGSSPGNKPAHGYLPLPVTLPHGGCRNDESQFQPLSPSSRFANTLAVYTAIHTSDPLFDPVALASDSANPPPGRHEAACQCQGSLRLAVMKRSAHLLCNAAGLVPCLGEAIFLCLRLSLRVNVHRPIGHRS